MTAAQEPPATPTPLLESDAQRRLIDQLRQHGVSKYIQLPQIAVMGDTSAGKSSVLSALSGIAFPSCDKLTTRCPTQLILERSGDPKAPFHARVFLQRWDTNKQEWEKVLDSKEAVTETIAEMTGELVKEGQVISNDAIVIHMTAPELPNLTLIDLPGLVRTVADGEEESMIERVRALVHHYLKQERTIILAVVPANVDIHNTEILQAAQEADPHGERTISVITKPDLVDRGAEDSVERLLRNEAKYLRLGYHMVKCRGQKQLNDGMSIEEAIKAEEVFFETHDVWSRMPRALVGIGKLRVKLGALLERRVHETLPSVAKEVHEMLRTCERECKLMGPAAENASARRALFQNYSWNIRSMLEDAIGGTYRHDFFSKGSNDEGGLDIKKRLRAQIAIAEEKFSAAIGKTRLATIGETEKGDKLEYLTDNGTWIDVSVVEKSNDYGFEVTDTLATWSIIPFNLNRVRPPLGDIISLLKVNRGDVLPIFPNYNVFRTLVDRHLQVWEEPTLQLVDSVWKLSGECWKAVVQHAASSNIPRLRAFLEMFGDRLLGEARDATKERLMRVLDEERRRPFTMNHYLFDILTKLRTEPLLECLKAQAVTDANNRKVITVDGMTALLQGFGIGSASNIEVEAREIQIALTAYTKVARKRYVDTVLQVLDEQLVRHFQQQMQQVLDGLDDDKLKEFLEESAERQQRRRDLELQRESLTKATQDLNEFLQGGASATASGGGGGAVGR